MGSEPATGSVPGPGTVTWCVTISPTPPHRSVLDSKESNLKAALQELESERGKERALQSRLEEEQLQHLQKEGQSSKTLEVPGCQGQRVARGWWGPAGAGKWQGWPGPVGGGWQGRWATPIGPSSPSPCGHMPGGRA